MFKKYILKGFITGALVCTNILLQAQVGWIQKASYPGANRAIMACFSIGNYGYVGAGWNGTYLNDMWKYDQVANTWTSITAYPGTGWYSPTSFAINGYGYVGLGWTGSGGATDLWRYDPGLNTWTSMATFPATGWYDAECFVLGHKCWVVCGSLGGPPYDQSVWMYDANQNTWT
ncbi:MAG TPA: kelch repeat-containing protein, partial [Bacteroidia bacterium]|nr:kelch repeat-containing protein [Bacteroidia bacterium]